MDTPEQTFAPQTKPLIEPIDTNWAQLILIRGLLNSTTFYLYPTLQILHVESSAIIVKLLKYEK